LAHKRVQPGGWTRQVTAADLHVSKEIAGVQMRLVAGGIRELHWHNASEWALMLAGGARITCIDPDGRSFVDDVKEGDIWNFPSGYPHSIQGLPPDGCEFLLVFDDGDFDEYETVLLTDWMVHTPPEVLAKNFGVPATAFPPPAVRRPIHLSGNHSGAAGGGPQGGLRQSGSIPAAPSISA
jgi:oxalate decarboxylase